MILYLAKLRGALVLATATGENAIRLVRSLGADEAADARSDQFVEVVRRFAPHGVDAILALAGGPSLDRCFEFVRKGGRVAYPNGVEPEVKTRDDIEISSYDAVSGPREFEELTHAIDEAGLKVPIEVTYPLEDAAKAHQRMEQGHVLGKLALRVANERT